LAYWAFFPYGFFPEAEPNSRWLTPFLDELFQYYHPERVGDFMDVVINAVCAAAGIILFLLISKGQKES